MILQRYLLLWLVLLSGLAWRWPEIWTHASEGGFDPFLETKRLDLLRPLFGVAMFCIGALLPRDEIRQVAHRWPAVLGGTAVQYAAMPLAALAVGHTFGLQGDLLTGVILVGCVPGAMASNVLTLAARGNVSYSVSLTTSATLLSPLVVPLVLTAALGISGHLDVGALFLPVLVELLILVVGPVIAGHVLSRSFAPVERLMRAAGPVVANLAILWIIAVVVGLHREKLGQAGPVLMAALLTINLLGYAAGWLGGRTLQLPEPMRRALTLEVGMQNAGLGAVLASSLFDDQSAAALPPALYTFGCMLTGTVLAQVWALRPAEAGLEASEHCERLEQSG